VRTNTIKFKPEQDKRDFFALYCTLSADMHPDIVKISVTPGQRAFAKNMEFVQNTASPEANSTRIAPGDCLVFEMPPACYGAL